MIKLKRARSFYYKAGLTSALLLGLAGIVSFAGGGFITVDSINTVVNSPVSYRWEPSSADTGGWMTSWHDIGSTPGQSPDASFVHAFTKTWNGSWANNFEHVTSGARPIMDSYTMWDPTRSKFGLVGVEYQTVGNSIWFHLSNDPTGATWAPMNIAIAGMMLGPEGWDFPSAAVDANTGRIVVGASKITGAGNAGYWTSYSTDGGATWNGPFSVNGATGGETSRIVWSASGFHAFIQDMTDPLNIALQHWQSSDGQTWTRQLDIATYGTPALSSPASTVCCNPSGQVSYAATPDAVAAPGLGWVVEYPVNIGGRNAINISTELGGGVTISHTTDLFNAGITTSSTGDWYLTYQTYQGGDQITPIQQGVVYRTPGAPSYLGAIVQQGINPSQWFYYNSNGRCSTASVACYTPGDFFRPAMNTFSGASVPMIVGSPNLNNMIQAFVRDPAASNVPQFLPRIEGFQRGGNLVPRAVFTTTHLQQIAAGHHKFVTSSMRYDQLRKAGRLP